ncbi:Alpha/Beta hydrolase protein [Daldinia sp. FL1419]|nr:Alpha/Beta hydrolase protein [Daldinia sp. FL1419]
MSANLGSDGMSSAAETPSETSSSEAEHKLLEPDPDPGITDDDDDHNDGNAAAPRPLVICFHGSGESCSPSWDKLAHTLTAVPHRLRVLLYDRGILNPRPPQATAELREYLKSEGLKGPCVLVAHSYGGAFARTFLEQGDAGDVEIVGMVLVETGQEGGLDPEVERSQYTKRVLGTRPLSVVRGNSLMRQWTDLETAETHLPPGDEMKKEDLRQRREMLKMYEAADEQMKKKQLDLAAMNARKRYVHVPDCGHHVVRDRPDVVAGEIAWVLENVGKVEDIDGGDRRDEGGKREKREKAWETKIKKIWRFFRDIRARLLNKLAK